MLSFTAANEEVENMVLEMYGHFEKVLTEIDPALFSEILPLIAAVFEKLDSATLKVKELENMLMLSENEKEHIQDILQIKKK